MLRVFVLVCLLVLALAVLIYRRRRAQLLEASRRLEREITPKEIEQAIREDIATPERNYTPGMFGNDEGGRSYVAGVDGAIRRVAIVDTGDGPMLLGVRKLGKHQRKLRKRSMRQARQDAARNTAARTDEASHPGSTPSALPQ